MFWVGIVLAISAIITTLVKELDEGKESEEVILHLSITELVLAIFSIVVSLSKHLIRHNTIVLIQKNIKVEGREEANKRISGRRKVQYILGKLLRPNSVKLVFRFAFSLLITLRHYQYLRPGHANESGLLCLIINKPFFFQVVYSLSSYLSLLSVSL